MKHKSVLIVFLSLLCEVLSAQSYHYQYSHDTLGNRVSRVYQGTRAAGVDIDITTIGGSSVISTERSEWRDLEAGGNIADTILGDGNTGTADKDTTKYGPFIKSPAEKEAYQESMMAAVMSLEPLTIDRGSRDLNDYSVGAIPLEYGVSGTGARTYSIPIFTAPDIKYAPSLAMVYNSQGGRGLCGYGWDLAGLSSITLVGRSPYWDNTIQAPSCLATEGVFCLDGIRLVTNDDSATSSLFPLVTATGHILVKPNRGGSGFIVSFTVLYPDGSTATFGTGSDLGFTLPSYPVVDRKNLEGERIEYLYSVDSLSGRHILNEIKYGINTLGSAAGRITFTYIGNTNYCYYAGKKLYYLPRLGIIKSYSGNVAFYTYELTHESFGDVDLLKSISVNNVFGEHLPPLTFTYGKDNPPHVGLDSLKAVHTLSTSGYFDPLAKVAYKRGKFISGSHNDGFIAYVDTLFYKKTGTHSYGCCYERTAPIVIAHGLADYTHFVEEAAEEGFLAAEALDTDGDGLDEIVKVNCVATNSTGSDFVISKYRSVPDSRPTLLSRDTVHLSGRIDYNNHYYPYYRTFRWGDFIGRGKPQLLVFCYSDNGYDVNQTSYASLIDLETGNILSERIYPFYISPDEDKRLLCLDIDGDSRTEICVATSSGLRVYRCGQNGVFILEKTHTNVPLSVINSDKVYYSDINADGYVDIVQAPSSGTQWTFRINNGLGFELRYHDICQATGNKMFMFVDINRDGYPDLLCKSGTTLGYYRNRRGMTFDGYGSTFATLPPSGFILPANIVDHAVLSSFVWMERNTVTEYGYTSYTAELSLLLQSRDSYGKIVRNTYGYLPQSSLYWTDNPSNIDASQGYQLRVLPIYVLTGAAGFLSDASDAQKFLQESYSWWDGVVHTQGLGFCGFSKIYTNSVLDGLHTMQENTFDPQKRGVPTVSRSYFFQGGMPILFAGLSYIWDDNTTDNGKLSPRLIQTTGGSLATGVSATTTFEYDSLDFPTRVITKKSTSGFSTMPSSVRTSYIHSNNPSRYVLGVVASQTSLSSKSLSTTSSMGTKTVFAYDTLFRPVLKNTYRVVSTITPAHVADSIYCSFYHASTERWQYDSHGNVIREESAPSGSLVYTGISYTYDSSGRHLVSTTDALGHTTTYSSFDIYGNPATVTNYKGQQTHSYRDGWGRVTRTVHPDGTVDSLARAWGGIGVYKEKSISSGTPDVLVCYDAAGREVLRSNLRFDGQWQKTKTDYDQRGLVSRVSLPYRGSSPSYWKTNTYDEYGRLTRTAYGSGRKTTWSYSGTSVTERKDGVRTTRTTNPAGQLVSVSDSLSTVTYTLRDDGQPSAVTAGTGVVTTFTYDTLGRRTSIVDPSAGRRSYMYYTGTDGSQTVTEYNALGSIITTSDRFGRTTFVNRPDFNTSFSYDTCGRLVSKISSNGTSSRYTYDQYDRLLTVKDSVPDGKWLQKGYTYNTDGTLSTVSYTNQNGYITSELYYYSNGHNNKTTMPNGTVIYQFTSENDLGQPTAASSAGVSRSYGYTIYGLPSFRVMAGGSLQNFSYNFDAKTGNLSSRTRPQNNSTITEIFSYDNLGRLSFNNGTSTVYDTNNNILYNGGNAVMTYDNPTHPYQITSRNLTSQPTGGTATQTITYKAYDRPATITQGNKTATFTYNADHERVRMHLSGVSSDGITRYYVGGRYEMLYDDGIATEFLYLGGDAYSAPMVLRRIANTSWVPYVIGRDHLGSITHIATTDGSEVTHCYYDAWGNRTNTEMDDFGFARGFCGHEHLDDFGLINMNARLYDPVLGRFLSPDPYIQAPDFPGNFNRYSYCLNNPLKYSDISGENPDWLIMAAYGGYVNWLSNGHEFSWRGLKYFCVGMAAGLIGTFGGGLISSGVGYKGFIGGSVNGMTNGALSAFTVTAGNSWLAGASFEDGMRYGARSAIIPGLIGAIHGGIYGGRYALRHFGDYWTGDGMIHDSVVEGPTDLADIILGEDMEYSNEYAKAFSDENFGTNPFGVGSLYADGTLPKGYSDVNGHIFTSSGKEVAGSAIYHSVTRTTDVYLYRAAFISKEELYLTMGHEYLHAGFNALGYNGAFFHNRHHVGIYKWEYRQAVAWNYRVDYYKARYDLVSGYKGFRYERLNFYVLATNPF